MKIVGLFLLLAGWLLVVMAVMLLHTETSRALFVLVAMGVEVLGLVLLFRAHPLARGGRP
ncbi:MAG TPA: hypothetical protein VKT49_09095 [Bryobacteraceae bacterium]|nr:hypothetical protein [Bryobacteraceae bacterium]